MYNPQIQEVLSSLGVSMEQLAIWLHWPYEKIAELATTSKDVSENDLKAIASELDIDVSCFFNDKYKILEGNF